MWRTALLSGTFVMLAIALLVGVGFAGDILSVDRDGTVHLRISSSGATTIAATDDSSAALSVAQNGVASAVESNGRTILQGKQSYTLTGTVDKNGSTTVTGTGTRFTREVRPGDRIEIPGGTTERKVVTAVSDDQTLTVSSAFTDTISGQTGTISQCAGEIITTSDFQPPIITLTQDPASPANDQGVYLQYQFRNNTGTLVPTGAAVKFVVKDVTAGSEDVDISFGAYSAGSLKGDILRIKGETGYIGIGTGSTVTTMLDVNNSAGSAGIRIRNTKTPTSSADAGGSVGDIAWDTSYLYIKTSAGWKRVALATW